MGNTSDITKDRQSQVWARDPDDWYVEPFWNGRGLFMVEEFFGNMCDPFCGSGRVMRAARGAGYDIIGFDIRQRTVRASIRNFWTQWPEGERWDNFVSNPPFGMVEGGDLLRQLQKSPDPLVRAIYARGLISLCLERTRKKCALILPASFIFGQDRSYYLERTPLKTVYLLGPKPSMPPGRVIEYAVKNGMRQPNGKLIGGGKENFVICVWDHSRAADALPRFKWLRKKDVEREHKTHWKTLAKIKPNWSLAA